MVTIVLLNDDLMCAMPCVMFFRSRRRGRLPPAAGLAMPLALLSSCFVGAKFAGEHALLASALLAGDCLLRALAGAGIRPRALASHGQAPAVPDALVGADLHLALDVARDLAAQVTF